MINLKARRKLRVLEGRVNIASAKPETGHSTVGQRTYNSAPSVGAPVSWVCVNDGYPGTWLNDSNLERVVVLGAAIDQGDVNTDGTLAWHMNDADGNETTIGILAGEYNLVTDITIPSTIRVSIQIGGVFDGLGTLTISPSSIVAGEYQIFGSNITITGPSQGESDFHSGEILAEWFGVPHEDTSVDSYAKLQAAIDYAQDADALLKLPRYGKIRLNTGLTIKMGKSNVDTKKYNFWIDGQFCTIYPDFASDHVFDFVPRCTYADRATGRGNVHLYMKRVNFNAYYLVDGSHSGVYAINLGLANYTIQSNNYGVFEDIQIEAWEYPSVLIENARHFVFNRLVTSQSTGGVIIRCYTAGQFTGDLIFNDLEVNGTETNRPLDIATYAISGTPVIGGVRFKDAMIYGSGTRIQAGTNGTVRDIWFENPMFDGPDAPAGEDGVFIYANGAGALSHIYFDEPFFGSHTGYAFYAELSGGSATSKEVHIIGGHFGVYSAVPIYFKNFNNFIIRGNHFNDITANYAIQVDDCDGFLVSDNYENGGSITHFIDVNTGSQDFIITGNAADVSSLFIDEGTSNTNWIARDNLSNQSTTVESAASLTVPATGEFFDISGTTNITSMPVTWKGHFVVLKFADILDFTDGSNLNIAGTMTTSANDTITLICDGTNWNEITRSAN